MLPSSKWFASCLLLLQQLLVARSEPRKVARLGLLVPVEETDQAELLERAVSTFNARSTWLLIEPVTVFISGQDALLRSGHRSGFYVLYILITGLFLCR